MAEALDPALPPDIDRLVKAVLEQACDRELTLATAESCTGGLLASLLTDIPGLSHAFERGFVVYTNEAKTDMLGVPPGLLDTDGAVSPACAAALVKGAIERSRADFAVSVTGFTDGPDAGVVHFGALRRGASPKIRSERFGDIGRAEVRLAALRVGLELFEGLLKQT